jgi:hypothetical protein
MTHKLIPEYEAELDICEASDASPHDGISWRRVLGASQVASELGELDEIQGERGCRSCLLGVVLDQLIEQIHLSGRKC